MDSGLALRAPRNDDGEFGSRYFKRQIQLYIPAARSASELCRFITLYQKRVQGRPGADRTHGPRATRKHAAEPQVGRTTGLPCAMAYDLYALSLGIGFLAPIGR